MFGAAAVRHKKRLKEHQMAASGDPAARGPYIKPFGPRFDPNDLPYFKYKRAMLEAQMGSNSTVAKVNWLHKIRLYINIDLVSFFFRKFSQLSIIIGTC